ALALLFLLSVPVVAAPPKPSGMDTAFAGLQAAKSVQEVAAPLAYVLAHSQEAPAPHLFLASAAAMQTGALQNAAFLFYAAQLRTRFDLARYPPKGTGGDSPGVALGALREQIGAAINPAIMREPKAFAAVVERVSAWSPATPAAYNPSWEYTAVDEKAGKKELDERRASFVKQFGALSTLLNDAQYFAAFKTLQDFNLGGQPHDAAHVKAKEAAEATMLSIEKKRNIEGIYYHPAQH
ncbi:MAG: hypothetical protein ACXV7D_00695, partial [Thermoanaerobaculia bacterium]